MTVNHDVAGSSPAGGAKTNYPVNYSLQDNFFVLWLYPVEDGTSETDTPLLLFHKTGGYDSKNHAIVTWLKYAMILLALLLYIFSVYKGKIYFMFDKAEYFALNCKHSIVIFTLKIFRLYVRV